MASKTKMEPADMASLPGQPDTMRSHWDGGAVHEPVPLCSFRWKWPAPSIPYPWQIVFTCHNQRIEMWNFSMPSKPSCFSWNEGHSALRKYCDLETLLVRIAHILFSFHGQSGMLTRPSCIRLAYFMVTDTYYGLREWAVTLFHSRKELITQAEFLDFTGRSFRQLAKYHSFGTLEMR